MHDMEALVCVEPGKLRLERRPAPRPDPSQVLVRPRRVGVCGTDYHIFEGKHPFLQYPRVMGHELAVEVVEAPAGSSLRPGQCFALNPYHSCGHCIACRRGKPNCCVRLSVLGVHQDGGMAQLLAVPADSLVPVDGLTLDHAATVEFLAIGAHAVRRAAVTAEDRVLVVGAGPIGLGVLLFAGLSGAAVAVLDHERARMEAAAALTGATPIEPDDIDAAMRAFTAGDGFDVVFDATGNQRAMEGGFHYVANGGRYGLVGVVKEPITFMDPDFHRKELTLLGSRNATAEDFATVIAAIRAGLVPVDRMITHRTNLEGAAADIARWATEKTGLIKAVIDIA
jgi:2-desacetyl-2-hydroxyethyl bacteriochlorophyllide A dehydrogenase